MRSNEFPYGPMKLEERSLIAFVSLTALCVISAWKWSKSAQKYGFQKILPNLSHPFIQTSSSSMSDAKEDLLLQLFHAGATFLSALFGTKNDFLWLKFRMRSTLTQAALAIMSRSVFIDEIQRVPIWTNEIGREEPRQPHSTVCNIGPKMVKKFSKIWKKLIN